MKLCVKDYVEKMALESSFFMRKKHPEDARVLVVFKAL